MRILLYCVVVLLVACGVPRESGGVRTGDLIFQVGAESAMNDAIAKATSDDVVFDSLDFTFTHVGIVVVEDSGVYVLEATTPRVSLTPIDTFLSQSLRVNSRYAVKVMRLVDTTGVGAAVLRAKTHIGNPYDYSYRPDNDEMYCSELVYSNYLKSDGTPMFKPQPMSFRATDGSIPRFWVELFDSLGMEIPEGMPGTNPNDMSRDSVLKVVDVKF